MVTLDKIRKPIGADLDAFDEFVVRNFTAEGELLSDMLRYALSARGKGIRPTVVLLAAGLNAPVRRERMGQRAYLAALLVEMIHVASLIHDDVIDETKLRRGYATVNSIWDNHIAVLVGDFFTATALHHSLNTADIRIAEVISQLGRQLSLGEIDQISTARDHLLSEESYFKIISNKTASLFVSCVRMGAYSVGVDDARLKLMEDYAELLGLCFQIKDDIFDYFSDEKIGKPTGNDLREGKVTLPLLYALSRDNRPEQPAMLSLSRKEELTADEIETLIEYAKSAGGIDYAYATMLRLYHKASEILDHLPSDGIAAEAKKDFSELFHFIINRDH